MAKFAECGGRSIVVREHILSNIQNIIFRVIIEYSASQGCAKSALNIMFYSGVKVVV